MECFKRFRNIDSHFASKQILKGQTIGGLKIHDLMTLASSLLQLNLQKAFTGIHYTDATVKITKQDSEQTVRQHHLQGRCSGLHFQVDFQVEENSVRGLFVTPPPPDSEGDSLVKSTRASRDKNCILGGVHRLVHDAHGDDKVTIVIPFKISFGKTVHKQKRLF